jgi:hypothetical protein
MTAALHWLGVGGYRGGFFWLSLLLAAGSAGVTVLALRGRPHAVTWALAVGLLGLTAAARLVDLAPPSAGRLAERMDGLELPFFKLLDEDRSGHSWCRPHCPRGLRTYDAPDTAPFAAVHAVNLALAQEKIVVVPPPRAERIRVRHGDITIEVRALRKDGDVTVLLDYRVVED